MPTIYAAILFFVIEHNIALNGLGIYVEDKKKKKRK